MEGFGKSIAVAIGINAYSNGIAELQSAVYDARELVQHLKARHGYTSERGHLLLEEEATKENIWRLLTKQLPAELSASDRLLLYYAGHGWTTQSDAGPAGYLLPYNADPQSPKTFLPMAEFHDALLSLECRHMLCVLDCCFAGAIRWSIFRHFDDVSQTVYDMQLDGYVRHPAWQILTSAYYDEKALDVVYENPIGRREGAAPQSRPAGVRDDEPHSPYFLAFLDGIGGAADTDNNGLITIAELKASIERAFEAGNGAGRRKQTPSLLELKKHDRGQYIFLNPERALKLKEAPDLTKPEHNPYRGLLPYTSSAEDAALFFGRDEEIKRLQVQVEDQPLTVVMGRTGVGKSSLVMAGLVPRLCRSGGWFVLPPLRPGRNPVGALASLEWTGRSVLADVLASGDVQSSNALSNAVRDWASANPDLKLLLVIDQMEELFALRRNETDAALFLALVREAISGNPKQLRVVCTLRSDFELPFAQAFLGGSARGTEPGHPLANGGSGPATGASAALVRDWDAMRFTVPAMQHDSLREVIEKPAAEKVVYFEPAALVDDLLYDVAGMPGALPLLSHTLSQLYVESFRTYKEDRAITLATYEELGGLEGALERQADREWDALDPDQQKTLRRVMLRMVSVEGGVLLRRGVYPPELDFGDHLQQSLQVESALAGEMSGALDEERLPDELRVRIGEQFTALDVPHVEVMVLGEEWKVVDGVHRVSLRREGQALRAGVSENDRVAGVIDRFGKLKLIVGSLDGEELVEPAHDVLVRDWKKVGTWIAEEDARADNLRFQRQLGQAAENYAESGDSASRRGLLWDDDPRATILHGLLAVQDSWLNARERVFAERSVEQNALNHRNRRVRLASFGMLGLMIVAIATVAYLRIRESRWDALANESRLLATRAEQTLPTDPVESIALAFEALPNPDRPNRPYVPEAEFALTQALQSSLERDYLATGMFIDQPSQVAVNDRYVALGSGQIRIVDYELKDVATLDGHDDIIRGMKWADESTLVSFDKDDVALWQDGRLISLHPFTDTVECAEPQPGGQLVAVCSGRLLTLWSPREGAESVAHQFERNFRGATWSPDGRWLLAWTPAGQVWLWDGDRREPSGRGVALELPDPGDALWTAGWSKSGDILVTAGTRGGVTIWSLTPAAKPLALPSHRDLVDGVTFLDAEHFLTWSWDGTVRYWDVDGTLVQEYAIRGEGGKIRGLVQEPSAPTGEVQGEATQGGGAGTQAVDGDPRFLAYRDNGVAHIWGSEIATHTVPLAGHVGSILDAAWQGDIAATAGVDGTVRLWETGDAHLGHAAGRLAGHVGRVQGLRWLEGGRLLTWGQDGTLRIWQVLDSGGKPICRASNTGETLCYPMARTLGGHPCPGGWGTWDARWLPDSSAVVSFGCDGLALHWTLATGASRALSTTHPSLYEAVWSADGQHVFTHGNTLDGGVAGGEIWSASGELVATIPGEFVWATWLEEGLVAALEGGDVVVVRGQPGTNYVTLKGNTGQVVDADAHFDAGLLATAGVDGLVNIWTLSSSGPPTVTLEADRIATAVTWNDAGTEVAVAGYETGVSIWDVAAQKRLWSEFVPEAMDLAFGPDDESLAIGANGLFQVRNASDGQLLWEERFDEPVFGVAWATGPRWDRRGESRTLLLTWEGPNARIWDVESRKEILRVTAPEILRWAHLSPDGAQLLTAESESEGTLRVWPVWHQEPSDLVRAAEAALADRRQEGRRRLMSAP